MGPLIALNGGVRMSLYVGRQRVPPIMERLLTERNTTLPTAKTAQRLTLSQYHWSHWNMSVGDRTKERNIGPQLVRKTLPINVPHITINGDTRFRYSRRQNLQP